MKLMQYSETGINRFNKERMATLLYLSQEGKMLNNQMSTLRFSSTALPTDYDTLKQKEKNLLTKTSKENLYHTAHFFPNLTR